MLVPTAGAATVAAKVASTDHGDGYRAAGMFRASPGGEDRPSVFNLGYVTLASLLPLSVLKWGQTMPGNRVESASIGPSLASYCMVLRTGKDIDGCFYGF